MPSITRVAGTAYLGAAISYAITLAEAPELHAVGPGTYFSGVAALTLERTNGTTHCSGSLLQPGYFVLTAAHCLTDSTGRVSTMSSDISFLPAGGPITTDGVAYFVHPGWTGDETLGFDVGLVRLRALAPPSVQRYRLYREADELGRVMVLAGYGVSGTGLNGTDRTRYPFGTLRYGRNRYDETGDTFIAAFPGTVLAYDFDDGTALHDAFGSLDITSDRGVGKNEAMITAGDSGGPGFLDGEIAGIHSFRAWISAPPDIDAIPFNSSFGEVGADTRVSFYAGYIDSTINVPEPTSGVLIALTLLLACVVQLWRGRRSD